MTETRPTAGAVRPAGVSRTGQAGKTPPVPDPALLHAIIEASTEGVVLCDADGRFVMVNSAAARLVPELAAGDPPAAARSLFDRTCPVGETRHTAHGDRLLQVRRERFSLVHHAWYLRDVTGDSARTDALLEERRRNEFLVEASRRLSASLNTRRCARATAELAASFLTDAAMVVLPPTGRHASWLRALPDGTLQEGTIALGDTAAVPGLSEALAGFPPVPSRWLDPAQAPAWLMPEGFGQAGHLLVTPLPGNGVPAGALVLARREDGPAFDEADEILVRVFAARAGAAISAAVLYQEQSATNATLTGDLLPPALPPVPGVEIAGSLRASQQTGLIGGDFYDVYLPDAVTAAADPGRRPLLTLGDVCGKGTGAAVLAGQVRQCLRALLLLEGEPERLVPLINRSLLASPARNAYVTLVLGALRPEPSGHTQVELAVAGHPAPLVLRADGTVEELASYGSMLGVLKQIVVTIVTVDLAPGDVLLLYSDGITEAFGGPAGREMFGAERLKAALATCAGMPVAAVVERLEQISTEWLAHGEHDDRALLAVQAVRPAPRARDRERAAR
ncbi:hypothetical protein Sru01_15800 [Sphaerisporangium rufum]|uniref:Serine phosphatase RsbU, regulator of sigma subunit n=1 Tax=Sphaerisporangium rufum TaxID=1381558 RepID=A0A919R090_9ACTN|nr:SpoIIE family protein phosphatase [Sphaerisporangium rufum]GII76598.1 hypothetical protein Sru01_15800 [Sphaerisporangium rufum]